jgi:hypothetical protein
MLYLEPCDTEERRQQLVDMVNGSPKLHLAVLGSTDKPFELFPNWNTLAIKQDITKEPLGYVATCSFNKSTVELHLGILPEFWGKPTAAEGSELVGQKDKLSDQVGNLIESIFKGCSSIKAVICFIPRVCTQTIELSKRFGFKEVGSLPDNVVYFGVQSDLVILHRFVTI